MPLFRNNASSNDKLKYHFSGVFSMAGEDYEDISTEGEEEDIYSDPEELLEDEDTLDDVDEGFMKGYNESEVVVKCAQCKKIIEDTVVEEEFDDETLKFCSQECLTAYEEKKLSKT